MEQCLKTTTKQLKEMKGLSDPYILFFFIEEPSSTPGLPRA
jgi:hypothetical protein